MKKDGDVIEMAKFYQHLNTKQKKEMRELLAKVITHRKGQVALLERTLIEPLKKGIDKAKDVQKNQISLEDFVAYNTKLSGFVQKFFGVIGEGLTKKEGDKQ